jgi:hypothetical protein
MASSVEGVHSHRHAPPIVTGYLVVREVALRDPVFEPPLFMLYLDTSDILTRTFFNRFLDFVAARMLEPHRDAAGGRDVWLPRRGVRMSVSLGEYDCDWPLMAVLHAPSPPALVLYGRGKGRCTAREMTFLAVEYASKMRIELYVSVVQKSLMYSENTNVEKNGIISRIKDQGEHHGK